jgi:glycosyltransferase involved in cell wall biosynthesis
MIPNRPEEHESVRWLISRVLKCLKRPKTDSNFLTLSFQESVPDWAKGIPGVKVIDGSHPLSEILENCRVVVLPFRKARPLENQILRLMASGRPIVTTGIGAAGLKVSPSQDLFVADRPDAFASCIQRLLFDQSLAERTAKHAHQTVQKFYLHSVVKKSIPALIDDD